MPIHHKEINMNQTISCFEICFSLGKMETYVQINLNSHLKPFKVFPGILYYFLYVKYIVYYCQIAAQFSI